LYYSLCLITFSKDRLRNSPSRDWIQQFVTINPSHACKETNSTELLDSFRYLHPSQEKAYTCWSTLLDSRKINYGTRIDYILLSKSLAGHLRKAEVWQGVEGSDHCPVFAELAMESVASSQQTQPSLSSNNFSGKQRKLSDFLRMGQKSSGVGGSGGSGLTAGAKVTLGKRSGSTIDPTSAAKTRKVASGKKKVDSKQSLVSFFKPVSEQSKDQPAANLLEDNIQDDSITSSEESKTASQEERLSTDTDSSSQSDSSANSGRKLSQAWKGVFGGPPKPPMCKGHNEPCVLRTVKKQGPNKNKQFWVCARPGGGKGDPEARCDFFQWKNAKQK
jgi:AP endonuclease-2